MLVTLAIYPLAFRILAILLGFNLLAISIMRAGLTSTINNQPINVSFLSFQPNA
jgi:hypothetical protein